MACQDSGLALHSSRAAQTIGIRTMIDISPAIERCSSLFDPHVSIHPHSVRPLRRFRDPGTSRISHALSTHVYSHTHCSRIRIRSSTEGGGRRVHARARTNLTIPGHQAANLSFSVSIFASNPMRRFVCVCAVCTGLQFGRARGCLIAGGDSSLCVGYTNTP